MGKQKNYGQEALEFGLVVVLVLCAGLFTFIVFGEKIGNLFSSESSVSKTNNNVNPTINHDSQPKYTPNYESQMGQGTFTLGEYEVTENSDGSISFEVEGQLVTLPSEAISLQCTSLQTTGSSGLGLLVNGIAKLIQTCKAENPELGNVPIELSYGIGTRETTTQNNYSLYAQTAPVNATAIKSGDKITIIQKDQNCSGSCLYIGTYVVEGSVNNNNQFTGQVVSTNTNNSPQGIYTANVDYSNGLTFYDATYTQTDINGVTSTYDWNITFDDSNNFFSI